MKLWKSVALAGALVVAGGLGAAFSPVAHGQRAEVRPRVMDVGNGSGSRIGVSIRDVGEGDAKAAGGLRTGVVIEEVSADGPAAKAGVTKGDIIVEFDGERVRSARQFRRLVQETPVGRQTPASLVRDGQKVNVTVEPEGGGGFAVFGDFDGLEELRDMSRTFGRRVPPPPPPAPPSAPAAPAPPRPPDAPPWPPDLQSFVWSSGAALGITVSDLSDQLAEHFGAKDGVLVTSVSDDSAGSKAGLEAGDVITTLNGDQINTPSQLRRGMQRLRDGDEFSVGIVRDRKPQTLKGKVEARGQRRGVRTRV